MTTIDPDTGITTLINTFTTTPENQQQILDLLTETTERNITRLPGFISANFHRSADGTRIVNYAQWDSPGALEAMYQDPGASAHIAELGAMADFDVNLYDVVASFSAAP